MTSAPAHAQHGSRTRLEWGPTGGAAISAGADIAVVVDVLSFTTTLSIATLRGTRVHPFPWKDERAQAHADALDAVLAVGRFEAQHLTDPPPSLSPAQAPHQPVRRAAGPALAERLHHLRRAARRRPGAAGGRGQPAEPGRRRPLAGAADDAGGAGRRRTRR
ncbi:hypothetical protein [Nocardioides convexus]|uniref:hypothetical protein n=1 Tax=Nocardioides convexus TaxID=2712224 RepID=UPI002418AA1C|nr:hypothetical protein [Nocardioides convexus]